MSHRNMVNKKQELLIHNGFELETDGAAFLLEFYDGEQRWFDIKNRFFEGQKVNLKPHRKVKDDQENQNELRKQWIAGEYPKVGFLYAEYVDDQGENWIGIWHTTNGETYPEEILLNTKYWGWY